MGNCSSNKYLADTMPMSDEEGEAVETLKRTVFDGNDGVLKPLTTTKLKIRITKRELEKLLSKVDVEELPVTEMLSRLIEVGDAFESSAYQGSWRPSLQSIPERN